MQHIVQILLFFAITRVSRRLKHFLHKKLSKLTEISIFNLKKLQIFVCLCGDESKGHRRQLRPQVGSMRKLSHIFGRPVPGTCAQVCARQIQAQADELRVCDRVEHERQLGHCGHSDQHD